MRHAEVASGADICGAVNLTNPCAFSSALCGVPPPTPEVITTVAFDDTFGLPTGDVGCGWAGFTAYQGGLKPATEHEKYIVTATTEVTLSVPMTWEGKLDDSGRGVVYYCPPPGILVSPFEVTFTATVQGVTGTAARSWRTSMHECPCTYKVTVTVTDEDADGNALAHEVIADVDDLSQLTIPETVTKSRCRTVETEVEAVSAFVGTTLWKWHKRDRWCWKPVWYWGTPGDLYHGRLLQDRTSVDTYPTDIDTLWSYDGEIYSRDQYYGFDGEQPEALSPRGGCYTRGDGYNTHWTECLQSWRTGHFDENLYFYTANQYPCIITLMYGDGRFHIVDFQPKQYEAADGDCHWWD